MSGRFGTVVAMRGIVIGVVLALGVGCKNNSKTADNGAFAGSQTPPAPPICYLTLVMGVPLLMVHFG